MSNEEKSCSVGGCGGPGLCPGVALLIAYVVGVGIFTLSDSALLAWVVGLPLGIALILGLPQRWLAQIRKSNTD